MRVVIDADNRTSITFSSLHFLKKFHFSHQLLKDDLTSACFRVVFLMKFNFQRTSEWFSCRGFVQR